ncbi:hypothetical protein HY450_00365 [Candidatus Pacearchaeota archaeon]|nr:hypothetical protein [Candidatus Pacearchaeota archaeon]
MNEGNTKKIDMRKVLTCSARDYIVSIGKSERDYELIGVHFSGGHYSVSPIEDGHLIREETMRAFISEVPKDAEVVVDYIETLTYGSGANQIVYSGSGTALIPRENEKVSRR